MKQKIISALYVLRECARRAVTPSVEYLFCGMLALAASAIPDENAWLRLVLALACVLLAVVLNVDQGVRVGRKHYQTFLSGEVRRSRGIETINNRDRKTYKIEMEYRPYKGFITGIIICIPVVICCIIYAAGNYAGSLEVADVGGVVLLMFCGWARVPLGLIFSGISPVWSLCACVLPLVATTVSYIIGANLEKKDYIEKQERMDSIRNGEKPISNREKKRRERENRKFR